MALYTRPVMMGSLAAVQKVHYDFLPDTWDVHAAVVEPAHV